MLSPCKKMYRVLVLMLKEINTPNFSENKGLYVKILFTLFFLHIMGNTERKHSPVKIK